jgi:D-alanyl-lipoteichoic acid acyltransferase DltB (MBOAT superfamily)
MSFATWYYPFFLLVIALAFWLLPNTRRLPLVLVASFVFYSFWDVRFCSLLIAAAASDYLCACAIEGDLFSARRVFSIGMLPAAWLLGVGVIKPVAPLHVAGGVLACLGFCALFIAAARLKPEKRRLALVVLGVGVNLGILAFFKYANWFSAGLQELLQHLGVTADSVLLDVLLPVGLSFHTFQSVAYVVDVSQGYCRAERNFWRILCMITFFPQLVAGPIERGARMLPQLRFESRFDWRFVVWGVHILVI